MIRLPIVFTALVAVLGACSKSPALPPPSAPKAAVPAAPITAVANPTPSLQDHMLRTSAIAAVAPPPLAAVPKPDTALPLDRYTALPPMEQNPLGYLKAAYFSSPLTEEQKLLLVSPRLAAEPDAFKRHEMMAAEQKEMAERLAGYAAQRYYAVPVGSGHALQFLGPPSGVTLMLDAYDFDRKAFPIGRIRDGQPPVMGRGCDAMPFSVVKQVQSPEDMQRQIMSGKPLATLNFIPIQMTGSELPCFLSVPDEATAKRIEAARVSQPGIHPIAFTTGTLYLYVTGAGDDGVHATVVHAHVNLGVFSMKHPAPDPLAEVDL